MPVGGHGIKASEDQTAKRTVEGDLICVKIIKPAARVKRTYAAVICVMLSALLIPGGIRLPKKKLLMTVVEQISMSLNETLQKDN